MFVQPIKLFAKNFLTMSKKFWVSGRKRDSFQTCQSIVNFSIPEPFLLEDPPSHFFLPENPEEPEFADWAETNVTAQLGGSVFLHCPVLNSGDRAVSYPSVSISLTINTDLSL